MTGGDAAKRSSTMGAGRSVVMVIAWLWVLIPFVYGIVALLGKIGALF